MLRFSLKTIACLSGFLAGSAFAGSPGGTDLCGVGWYLFKDKSIVSTALRSTTNVFLPPTFSMTSGTSNCDKHTIVKLDKREIHFIEANFENLRFDIAKGDGEFVHALFDTMNCQSTYQDTLSNTLKQSFTNIYSHPNVTVTEVLGNIKGVLHNNGYLNGICAHS